MSEEIQKVKTDIIDDPENELINHEAEKFLQLFERAFSEKHEKNIEHLNCDDGIVSNILSKVAQKIREIVHSEEASDRLSKAKKFLKIIDNFFHSIFDSK